MPLPTRAEAQAFFAELEAASAVARSHAVGKSDLSPWGEGSMPPAIGIVIHYTAGGSFRGSVDWLCDEDLEAKASAHCVIGRGHEAWADAGVKPGGVLASLPASVVQLRLPTQTAWHATWANGHATEPGYIGIELASDGEVRKDAQGILRGPNGNWTEKVADTTNIVNSGGRLWQPYTPAQIQTAAQVAQYYRALFPSISPENIVGHEHVQGVRTPERIGCEKRDAGIFFDYAAFRTNVILGAPGFTGNLVPRMSEDLMVPLETMMGSLLNATKLTATQLDQMGAYALKALGYSVDSPIPGSRYFDAPAKANLRSLYQAQRMLGLVADSKLGPKTAAALAWRLKDRWTA